MKYLFITFLLTLVAACSNDTKLSLNSNDCPNCIQALNQYQAAYAMKCRNLLTKENLIKKYDNDPVVYGLIALNAVSYKTWENGINNKYIEMLDKIEC